MKKYLILPFFCFLALTAFSQVGQNKYKFNVDLMGGVGSHKFIGEDIKDNKSTFNFFYSARARYKFYKNFEIETGFGQSQFGTFKDLGYPTDLEKTYNIPVLIRIPITKHFSAGIGPEFNLLESAIYKDNQVREDQSEYYSDNFWGTYVDIKVADNTTSLSVSYSQGIDPARDDQQHTWRTGALRFSVGLNLAAVLRMRLFHLY